MQRDVIDFLSTPAAYGLADGAVERIDTHISVVWLAGERAYKLKREVRFDYVDFSTPELRRVAREAEVRLNRRTAPALYLGVRAVTRSNDGILAIDGAGQPVDWLVEMRRFDQDTLFDRLADRGQLDISLMEGLASTIAALHAGARIRSDRGGRAGMAWVADGNAAGLLEHGEHILDAASCAVLAAATNAAVSQHAHRLDGRRRGGLVRACHGDLHLRNICLIDGTPTIFDGVEFNDDISCIDILYDVAFLLMDLWRRGLRAHANVLFNEYIRQTTDVDALCLLPLFFSCRAAVRAKTSATAARMQADSSNRHDLEMTARRYLALAHGFLHPAPPRLIAIGGFSGSGKSTLARGLAPDIGAAPGALIVRSDDVRKALMGVAPVARLGASAYTPAANRRVYDQLTSRVFSALQAGHSVIADAVFARPEDRQALAIVARTARVSFTGLWIDGSRELLARRIAERRLDVSDATVAVLDQQIDSGVGALDWHHLSGERDAAGVLERAIRLL